VAGLTGISLHQQQEPRQANSAPQAWQVFVTGTVARQLLTALRVQSLPGGRQIFCATDGVCQGREQRNRANDRVDRDAGNNTVHRVACAAALNRGPGQELPIHASYRVDSCVGKKSVKRIACTAVLKGEHGEDQRIRANDGVDSRAGKSSVQRTRVPPH
jgi:hypothetical protein